MLKNTIMLVQDAEQLVSSIEAQKTIQQKQLIAVNAITQEAEAVNNQSHLTGLSLFQGSGEQPR